MNLQETSPRQSKNLLKVQEVVNLTLTFDHRWINGVGSASFMADVRKNIETFKLPD